MKKLLAALAFSMLAPVATAQTPVVTESITGTYSVIKAGVTVATGLPTLDAAKARAVELERATPGNGKYAIRQPNVNVLITFTVAPPPPPPPPPPPVAGAKYLSPTGSDTAACTQAAPCKTFAKVFASSGEVILLDGTYSVAAGTGVMSYLGAGSAQPPSGMATAPTVVRALNPGKVVVDGPLFVGRSTRKDSHIRIQGITFKGGGSLYNSSFVTLKDVGFAGSFSIGTNDHANGNTDNLIEDVWIWASGSRIIAINYRAHRNVWRRVVIRGDGCGTAACSGSGNPNVGFTVYDSSDVSVQNVMLLDRVLGPTDSPYADFACAQHTADPQYWLGRVEWLGVVSLNAPDQGFYCEPDAGQTLDPTTRMVDSVFWNTAGGGINMARAGTNRTVDRVTVKVRSGDGIRIAPELTTGTLTNAVVLGSGRYGINSKYTPANTVVSGTWQNAYNQTTCTVGCSTTAPAITSILSVAGGAQVTRYGTDGTRHGQAGFNVKGGALMPWPNEARIKAEMCVNTARGFCSAASLSEYLSQAR